MLEVKELKTIFSTQDGVVNAVNDISFSLQSGEAIGIVGTCFWITSDKFDISIGEINLKVQDRYMWWFLMNQGSFIKNC